MAGQLDPRLLDLGAVTRATLDAVAAEHNCAGLSCPACGHEVNDRQPVCRSVAVVRGLRAGRAPRWREIPAAELVADYPSLFEVPGGER